MYEPDGQNSKDSHCKDRNTCRLWNMTERWRVEVVNSSLPIALSSLESVSQQFPLQIHQIVTSEEADVLRYTAAAWYNHIQPLTTNHILCRSRWQGTDLHIFFPPPRISLSSCPCPLIKGRAIGRAISGLRIWELGGRADALTLGPVGMWVTSSEPRTTLIRLMNLTEAGWYGRPGSRNLLTETISHTD